jgi:hypothetical protein
MKNPQKSRWLLLGASLLALGIASGCGDDDQNPTPGDNVIGGTKGNAGSGNKAGNTGKAGASDPGEAGSGNGSQGGSDSGPIGQAGDGNVGGAGGEQGNPIPECNLPETGADGCFNCPKTDEQYLNRCTPGTCVSFDNDRLTKLNADGSLPDLN